MRGVRGPARRMETSPAPGSLWFLSPAGKELVRPQTHETPSSHTLNPARVPPSPHPIALPCSPSQLLAASIPSNPKTTKKREARRFLIQASLSGFRQRPTLPGRVQPSTIGAEGLNFCVRYGNRWYPFAIITGNCELVLFPHTLTTAQHFFDLNFLSLFPISLSDFASKSSPRPISIIKLHSLPNFHR